MKLQELIVHSTCSCKGIFLLAVKGVDNTFYPYHDETDQKQ